MVDHLSYAGSFDSGTRAVLSSAFVERTLAPRIDTCSCQRLGTSHPHRIVSWLRKRRRGPPSCMRPSKPVTVMTSHSFYVVFQKDPSREVSVRRGSGVGSRSGNKSARSGGRFSQDRVLGRPTDSSMLTRVQKEESSDVLESGCSAGVSADQGCQTKPIRCGW